MDAPPVSSIEVTKEYSVVDNDGDNTNNGRYHKLCDHSCKHWKH